MADRHAVTDPPIDIPEMLQVLRYERCSGTLRVVVGDRHARLPNAELEQLAASALRDNAFVCHTAEGEPGLPGDQICLIPRGDHCEVLTLSTNGGLRHHGDHRRGLLEILNDIAAAVARGTLHFLDDDQLVEILGAGDEVLSCAIDDGASLARARQAVGKVLESHAVAPPTRRRMTLCVSEATTNVLLHGGGSGALSVRQLDDRLRVVVADSGPGLDFLAWTREAGGANRASMGYGFKLILDNLTAVYLHTGNEGTTLILEHAI